MCRLCVRIAAGEGYVFVGFVVCEKIVENREVK